MYNNDYKYIVQVRDYAIIKRSFGCKHQAFSTRPPDPMYSGVITVLATKHCNLAKEQSW